MKWKRRTKPPRLGLFLTKRSRRERGAGWTVSTTGHLRARCAGHLTIGVFLWSVQDVAMYSHTHLNS